MARAGCCALCIDIVVLLRHQLAKSNETVASWNALGLCTAAHRVYSPCGPCEEVAKRIASPSKAHWFGRNLEATLVPDRVGFLQASAWLEYSKVSQLTNCIRKVAMITHHTLTAIANLLAILAVILAVAYHVVALNVRQVEQKRQG